ncbi:hypothetical protein H9X77_17245, partial [Clostridium saudiense]|nr:hypothetical protein [Clostridium saudiense]
MLKTVRLKLLHEGKRNKDSVHYETPELESILDVTYGVMVYQEQVMEI